MKTVIRILVLSILCTSSSYAQQTKSFQSKGKVKIEINVDDNLLNDYTIHSSGSITITNLKGELKSENLASIQVTRAQ